MLLVAVIIIIITTLLSEGFTENITVNYLESADVLIPSIFPFKPSFWLMCKGWILENDSIAS